MIWDWSLSDGSFVRIESPMRVSDEDFADIEEFVTLWMGLIKRNVRDTHETNSSISEKDKSDTR
jgi:hypothetical protein